MPAVWKQEPQANESRVAKATWQFGKDFSAGSIHLHEMSRNE
jgi:hypothetical protein